MGEYMFPWKVQEGLWKFRRNSCYNPHSINDKSTPPLAERKNQDILPVR